MSPSPEVSSLHKTSPAGGQAHSEFSPQERAFLVNVAHQSIEAALEHRELSLDPPSARLAEPRGAFTTIYCRGDLRGCVGYVLPAKPLYLTVAETARAAAFDDPRFSPVTPEEAAIIKVSLSILSLVSAIQPEVIEVGRHGLVIAQAGHRGLLLPQVAVEHGWGRVTFLEETCRKAGLPRDAWKHGATLQAFTAEVFGDRM